MALYPSLDQINTRVWLRKLANTLGRPATLADIPDAFLDQVAAMGFDYVWFLGLWQTGLAGRQVSLSHREWLQEFQATLPDFTEADISGSPFAVTDYRLHQDFGPEADLLNLKERLWKRGLKLMVDFVPNHSAPDHPWVKQHPEFYVQGSEADLEREPQNYRRLETPSGSLILAYGRDPYFADWPDTFQLNYRHPRLREAMARELLKLAGIADGVRCDMAMLILPEVFQRTWGDLSWPTDDSPAVDEPFWPETIERVKAKNPGFIFMAEVYWGSRSGPLCSRASTIAMIRVSTIVCCPGTPPRYRSHLWADLAYQNRLARFLENHDEPRAAHEFPPPVHQAAAVITFLTPGLRFFHEGQLEGRRVEFHHALGPPPRGAG